jgi:hypothetical protein
VGFGYAALAGQGWLVKVRVMMMEVVIFGVFPIGARLLGGTSKLVQGFGLSCGLGAFVGGFFGVF